MIKSDLELGGSPKELTPQISSRQEKAEQRHNKKVVERLQALETISVTSSSDGQVNIATKSQQYSPFIRPPIMRPRLDLSKITSGIEAPSTSTARSGNSRMVSARSRNMPLKTNMTATLTSRN